MKTKILKTKTMPKTTSELESVLHNDFNDDDNDLKIMKPDFSFFLFSFPIAAPEMLKGDVVGPPADIWSVGVLTFVM